MTAPHSPSPARRSWIERIPNAFILIFGVLVVTVALTWVVSPGQFERVDVEGRTQVVPNSFQRIGPGDELPPGNTVRPAPQGIMSLLQAPLIGFQQAAYIIVFILVIGGAFKVIDATGAIRSGMARVVMAFRGNEILIIPIVMVMFSLGGATFGMSEETIPFVMLMVPLALALGYDSITGVCMAFVAAGAGFASAFINPFTLGVAQGIAELPPVSGFGYRVFVWLVITGVTIAFVMRYASRIRRNPELSPTFADDQRRKEEEGLHDPVGAEWREQARMSGAQKLVIAIFTAGMVLLVVGVLEWDWYVNEIGALFFGIGILAAIVARLGADETAKAFVEGAGELLGAALVVGLARGVVHVAEMGGVIDPALNAMASVVGAVPSVVSAQMMFIGQTVLNFFVPSGSGQAALTMPLMTPLADLVGVTRQTAVLAYQFGDGFSNMIIPTSPVLLGVLGAARISWSVWLRWIIPLQIIFVLLGLLLLIPPVLFGWGPH
jgi:uncharacterized ion transporter superfamily protein YfcC